MEKITVKFVCPMCGKIHYLRDVDLEKFLKYQNGEGLVQDLFPELNTTDREKLITGYCEECQDTIFAEVEED